MLAITLALASSLAYGFADFAGGLATRGAHALRVILIAAPASLAVELLLLPALGAKWSAPVLVWGSASGVASTIGFALLYLTLARGPMSVLSPVTALVSEALPVAVGIGLGEHLHILALIGLPLSAVAVLLLSAARDRDSIRPPAPVILLAVGAGGAIAAQLICLSQSPADSGVGPLVVGRAVTSILILGAVVARRHRLGEQRPSRWLCAVAGALDSLANLAFLLATRHGQLAIVAVISALYPASTLVLARFVLKERLSILQVSGLGLAAGAVVLLALP